MMRTIATTPPTPPPTPTPPASPQPLHLLRDSQRRAIDIASLATFRDEPAPKPVPLPPGAPKATHVPTGVLAIARWVFRPHPLDAIDADNGCVL